MAFFGMVYSKNYAKHIFYIPISRYTYLVIFPKHPNGSFIIWRTKKNVFSTQPCLKQTANKKLLD